MYCTTPHEGHLQVRAVQVTRRRARPNTLPRVLLSYKVPVPVPVQVHSNDLIEALTYGRGAPRPVVPGVLRSTTVCAAAFDAVETLIVRALGNDIFKTKM